MNVFGCLIHLIKTDPNVQSMLFIWILIYFVYRLGYVTRRVNYES